MPEDIEPDYKHEFKLFKDVLLLPITLLLVLFKKKEFGDIFAPIKDLWEYFWEAKFTAILIILNILVSVSCVIYIVILPDGQRDAFVHNYLMDGPANLLSLNIIPFVSNWFVQLSWQHLLGNIVALFFLGRVVEKNFGPLKFGFIYFGSAIISGLVDDLVHITDLQYYASGASGAIAGLASAAMLVEPFYLVCLFIIPIPVFIFGWMQLYFDVTDVLHPSAESAGVANFAHLGGFFAIMILAFFLSSEEKSKLWRGLLINIGTLLVLGLIWWFVLR